jgi:hypothetical protein
MMMVVMSVCFGLVKQGGDFGGVDHRPDADLRECRPFLIEGVATTRSAARIPRTFVRGCSP